MGIVSDLWERYQLVGKAVGCSAGFGVKSNLKEKSFYDFGLFSLKWHKYLTVLLESNRIVKSVTPWPGRHREPSSTCGRGSCLEHATLDWTESRWGFDCSAGCSRHHGRIATGITTNVTSGCCSLMSSKLLVHMVSWINHIPMGCHRSVRIESWIYQRLRVISSPEKCNQFFIRLLLENDATTFQPKSYFFRYCVAFSRKKVRILKIKMKNTSISYKFVIFGTFAKRVPDCCPKKKKLS